MAKPARAYFLMKSEPSTYAFATLQKDRVTFWDGVRNYAARNIMRSMNPGDLVLFYHSNEGKEVVGIARIRKTAYQDPTTEEDWSVVDIEPVQPLVAPVSLETIKNHQALSSMQMIKQNRLSVSMVTADEFDIILKLGKTKLAKA